MEVGLEVHDGAGDVLGQAVVDFVGDELPLLFLDFEQSAEHAAFMLQFEPRLLQGKRVRIAKQRLGLRWRLCRQGGR